MWFKGCLCVFVAAVCVEAGVMVIPKEVQNLMATVKDLESFMKAFHLGNITLDGDPSLREPVTRRPIRPIYGIAKAFVNRYPKTKRLNKVIVGRLRVVSFSDTSKPPFILENEQCKPYPTVVKVPQPDHNRGIHYPFHVMLHRCAGSCNRKPRIQTCEPIETHEINLLSFVVSWSSPSDKRDELHRSPLLIKMLNHTECGCKCIAKPTDCNPVTQRFSEDNCRCECKIKQQRCPMYHFLDVAQCKCVCNPPQNISCPKRFEWSPQKCSCVCKNTKCRANKVRNNRNCRCYCPKKLPPCGLGLRRSRRDCKCKPFH